MGGKPVTYKIWNFARHKQTEWLFERVIPSPPISPFIGMEMELPEGKGDTHRIVGVRWYPETNEIHLRLNDDVWSDDYNDQSPPDLYVDQLGWTLIDGPLDLSDFGSHA